MRNRDNLEQACDLMSQLINEIMRDVTKSTTLSMEGACILRDARCHICKIPVPKDHESAVNPRKYDAEVNRG